jgi:hypothetical protein
MFADVALQGAEVGVWLAVLQIKRNVKNFAISQDVVVVIEVASSVGVGHGSLLCLFT